MPSPLNPPISRISFYSSAYDTAPSVVEWTTWADLVQILGGPRPFLDKKRDVPMFAPHELVPPHVLGKDTPLEHFRGIHFGVFDIDDKSDDDLARVLVNLPCPYLYVSSWSYSGGGVARGRLIVPFMRTVLPSEWGRVWPVLNSRYVGGLADPACRDVARRYWIPSFPEGAQVPPVYLRNDYGQPLDIDAALLEAGPLIPAGSLGGLTSAGTPTRGQLRTVADTWSASTRTSTRNLGAALRAVANGDPYSAPGERDVTTYKLCSELVRRWPSLDARATAEMFAPSLQLMEAAHPGAPTLEKVADILTRRQAAALQDRNYRIGEAIGREDPYTPEELDVFCAMQGCSRDQLQRSWIVQRGRSFYVLVLGSYRGPFISEEIGAVVRRDLAPATSVELDVVTERGVRPKTLAELMRDYGAVADDAIADMTAQYAHYDRDRHIIVEAPCPRRVPIGEFNPQIDAWLRRLAGTRYPVLEQWIAAVTRLEEPCAALYFEGDPGAGKSLFAEGLARLWGGRPTTMDEALGDFNDQAARNPLIFADETSPFDAKSGFRTADLRRLVQTQARRLSRKYQSSSTLRGSSRLIFAANNRNDVGVQEQLNHHDIEALVVRILHIVVQDGARRYLEELKAADSEIFVRWVDGDGLARHALWLVDHVTVVRQSRFLVGGDSEDLVQTLATSTGVRSGVCNWLVGFMQNPKALRMMPTLRNYVRVRDGELLVNAKAVSEGWNLYVLNDRNPPTPMQISRAIAGLSKGGRIFLGTAGRDQVPYRRVDLNFIAAWAEQTGYMTPDDIAGFVVAQEGS